MFLVVDHFIRHSRKWLFCRRGMLWQFAPEDEACEDAPYVWLWLYGQLQLVKSFWGVCVQPVTHRARKFRKRGQHIQLQQLSIAREFWYCWSLLTKILVVDNWGWNEPHNFLWFNRGSHPHSNRWPQNVHLCTTWTFRNWCMTYCDKFSDGFCSQRLCPLWCVLCVIQETWYQH
jgi:hypothetical protein